MNRDADVGVNAFGNHQEKNAPFREQDFAFINSLKNTTQKKSEVSSRTKLCSGNKKKITSDLSQWSDELQVEKVITLKDFDKWRKNGIDEYLQNRCNLTLNQGTHRKKPISAQKVVAISGLIQEKTEHDDLRSFSWQCICSKTKAKFAFKPTQKIWRG